MQNYRLKCRNVKCGSDFLRRYSSKQWEEAQYTGATPGVACFNCGFPSMAVMRSEKMAKDGFVPGYQRNIRKHCSTYAEYKGWFKIMGLIEFGYEDLPEYEDGTPAMTTFSPEMCKKIYDLSSPEDRPTDIEFEYLKNMHKEKDYVKNLDLIETTVPDNLPKVEYDPI